jgi:plasmid stabilization system protein ParE
VIPARQSALFPWWDRRVAGDPETYPAAQDTNQCTKMTNQGTKMNGNSPHASPFSLAQTRTRAMPRGDKSKYTGKQERKADHIAESYEQRGVPASEAERRAWATVNKDDGGGKRAGSGRGARTGHPAAHRGGEAGGKAAAARPAAERQASAKKAAATRKRNAASHHAPT